MAVDLRELVRPAHTVLITQECQQGIVGSQSLLPAMAEAARAEMIPNIAGLASAARCAGVRVIHCIAIQRLDGYGRNTNARLFQATKKSGPRMLPGSEAIQVLPEIGATESDVVISRMHGLSPFHGTELDSILRNAGVRTLVVTGVSVNVAIMNLTFDAVNAAYQVVIPRDAVAGVPREYVDAVFANTLGAVATLTSTKALLACWQGIGPGT
jgi:nicotinamidase-related amidase